MSKSITLVTADYCSTVKNKPIEGKNGKLLDLLVCDSAGFCVHNLFNQFPVSASFHSNGKMWAGLSKEISLHSFQSISGFISTKK